MSANDHPTLTNDHELALEGYDPVAYFTRNEAVHGDPEIAAERDGVVYRFENADNRDTFLANPDKYTAQYGGYCATAMSEGKLVPANPARFKVTDGKLYLFYKTDEDDTYPAWVENEDERRREADEAWSKGAYSAP